MLRNVGDSARHFPAAEPILCYGCGDGLEVEAWRLLGFTAYGCELSINKRRVAKDHGLRVYSPYAPALREMKANIYCAHTMEHLENPGETLRFFAKAAISTICLIFPVESMGSKNPSHLSPVAHVFDFECPSGWHIARMEERFNDEPEGVVVYKEHAPQAVIEVPQAGQLDETACGDLAG